MGQARLALVLLSDSFYQPMLILLYEMYCTVFHVVVGKKNKSNQIKSNQDNYKYWIKIYTKSC